jgi:type II secretory pathway pseudopilin PulG
MSTERAALCTRPRGLRRGGPRRAERAFTLVELLVSMVAGLMVALAVVGLSREASNTFHEETRIAGAEMQIRAAMDRIRADLSRAAFMSTGNIWIDPMILPSTIGATTNVAGISSGTFKSTTDMSLYSLAGLQLNVGGSAAATPLSATNGLSPDSIDIAGNLTSAVQLPIGGATSTTAPIVDKAGCSGAGQRVYLDVDSSPALWQLVGLQLGASDAGTPGPTVAQLAVALNAAFQPVPLKPFIVRIVDQTGKAQYGVTCATLAAGWAVNAGIQQAWVDLDSTSPPILIAGTGGGTATINPIQIVHWQVQGALVGYTGAGGDTTKYDLTRQYVDATGALLGSPEVVAEYVADLKFAFAVDNTLTTTGNFAPGGTSSQVVLAFEDPANATIAGDVTKETAPPLTDLTGPQPQRIRSIRVRLATRAELPDRTEPLDAGLNYLYRYCIASPAANCVAGAPVFARTRTIVTEVALPNQARLWYR